MVLVPRLAKHLRKPGQTRSPAATAQLQRGWELTGTQDTAVVPLLEKVFNDADLYTRPLHTFHFGQSATKTYITPETPVDPTILRGAHAVFVQGMMANGFLRSCQSRYRFPNNLGTLYYFPPWHPAAQARFSRPALVVLRQRGAECNGKTPVFKSKLGRSLVPFDYAVFRNLASRRVKLGLKTAWTKQNVVDGLYVMQISSVPGSIDFMPALKTLAKSSLKAKIKFDAKKWDAQLKRLRHAPVTWRLDPKQWR